MGSVNWSGCEQRYVRVCGAKHAHATESEAKQEAARMSQVSGRRITHYACPYCGKFHVGGEVRGRYDMLGRRKGHRKHG